MNILKKHIRFNFIVNFNRKESYITLKKDNLNHQTSFLSLRRLWVRLGSLFALSGYVSQMAGQFLIVSGLLVQTSPSGAMEEHEGAVHSVLYNPDYYYTDEDIETCINAMIAYSPKLERVPGTTYLLKPKGTECLTFPDPMGKFYYVALLPSCSCIAGLHEMDMGIPALPITYCLDRSNQISEFGDLLQVLLSCDDILSMEAHIDYRKKETDANYADFESIIKGSAEDGGQRKILQIKSQLRHKLSFYQRLRKDVFDELLFQTSDLNNAYYKIVFPFCQNNSHWYVGEILGKKNGINDYSFTVMAHNPYGGGDFRETFPEDAVEIRECLDKRLSLPYLKLDMTTSPYQEPRQGEGDGISCGPIMTSDLFKIILGRSLGIPVPYEYGAIPLRKKQIEIVRAVIGNHYSLTLSQAEAAKFLEKNERWVQRLESLQQNRRISNIPSKRQISSSTSLQSKRPKSGLPTPLDLNLSSPLTTVPTISFSVVDSDLKSCENPSKLYQDSNHPLTHEFWKTRDLSSRLQSITADIQRLKKGTMDYQENLFGINELEKYKHILRFSECDNDLVQYLIDRHNNQPINDFAIKEVWGSTNSSVILLSRENINFIAIKQFKDADIEKGLQELLYSLIALNINPSPQELKMTKVYDAIIYPENCLNLIMEGANTHSIYNLLPTNLAENALKACAQYLAMFHVRHYLNQTRNTDRQKYIEHVAQAFNTLKDNPFKEQAGMPLFCSLTGEQLTDTGIEEIRSNNIMRLLSKEEQEKCAHLVEENFKNFETNCAEIFRSLKLEPLNNKEQEPYFLTITHGDAHGNNFFYNKDASLEIPRDSFYRIAMIDFASIIRTYGDVGDPAEDIGRFLGSLWDWGAQQDISELGVYEQIWRFQNNFIQHYLEKIKENLNHKIQINNFYKIFEENCNFYKLRFYKVIFNSKVNPEIKLRILRSWMKENADLIRSSQENPQPNILAKESNDRSWKSIDGYLRIIRWLPKRPIGFIESKSEGSDKSYLTLLWEELQGTGSATIAGMAGVGKTSHALEYAHEAFDHKAYPLIYWLLSGTEASLLRGYRNLLRDIGVSIKDKDDDRIIELIKQKVPKMGKCLLVYDNVPDPEFLNDKIPPNTDTLITTRRIDGWDKKPIGLDVFRPEDSIKYLLTIMGIEENSDNKNKAAKLAHELAHFPLALSHAAHYIKLVGDETLSGNTIEKYIKDFKEKPALHFKEHQDPFKANELEMTYENLIGKTYSMSSHYISDLAKKLMVYCCYINSDSIAEDIFLEGSDNKSEIQDAFARLSSLSLINRIENESLFSIHRLVQLVIRNEQELGKTNQKNQELLRSFCEVFNSLFVNNTYSIEQIDKLLNYLPHILTLIGHSKRLDMLSSEVDSLEWVGRILYTMGEDILMNKGLILSQKIQSLKQRNIKDNKKLLQFLKKTQDLFKDSLSNDLPAWLIEIAEKSHPKFLNTLGFMFTDSEFVNNDYNQAILWYRKAAEQGDATAQFNLGSMYANCQRVDQNYPEALKWYNMSADQGHVEAQYNLGCMYYNGEGMDQRYTKAFKWYTRAANQGHTEAQYSLGEMYTNGKGVEQSYTEALKWRTKSVKQRRINEQYLNMVHGYDEEVHQNYEVNDEEAMEHHKRLIIAAEQGDRMIQGNLGMMYAIGIAGVDQNLAEAIKWYTMAAEQGYSIAQYHLGEMYENGQGLDQNFVEAFKWYSKAADGGIAGAQYNLGAMYENGQGVGQNYDEAYKRYTKAADGGIGEALYKLGFMYENGVGGKQNYTEALKWYTKAAIYGDAMAHNNIGLLYEQGRGVAQDYEEAFKWYIRAARQGEVDAQYNLERLYANGEGVKQNYTEALKWYKKAANQGQVDAQYNLGEMYYDGEGVEQSYAEAFQWYTMAAEQGDPDAQCNLGAMYYDGEGVKQSYAEAFQLYTEAANQGQADAQYNLGHLYANGEGVKQNYTEALKWYRKAANQGQADAQYNLGRLYANGEGVKQNYTEALKWYKKAANQGQVDAQYNLGEMYYDGEEVDQNYTEALQWYTMAAEQGDPDAQCNLGAMYYSGQGVDPSYAEAFQWYTEAANQGQVDAQYNLGAMSHHGEGVDQDFDEAFTNGTLRLLSRNMQWLSGILEQCIMMAKEWIKILMMHSNGTLRLLSRNMQWLRIALG